MNKELQHLFPLLGIEKDCILSRAGDITIVFKVTLPELFTLSNDDYEAIHQTLIKALKVLPKHTVYHQQDWFIESKYKADYTGEEGFFFRSSERFFNERPYLDHSCYIMLTKKPSGGKSSSSLFSTLTRRSILPKGSNDPAVLQNFFDAAGQFSHILTDGGFISVKRLSGGELESSARRAGLSERYCFLKKEDDNTVKDIHLKEGLQIGGQHCLLYTLGDTVDAPSLCGSRISYDRYSTDKTRFSIGFSSGLGQLLPCNHIYNQYIFIDDAQKTIRRLENKRLRLQSLSAYSRENTIARESVNSYLNEAISDGRQPVKAHFNILVWTEDKERLQEIRNMTSSALAAMDATPKVETSGAAQIWWAGMPGNEGDFPMNDTWDTFLEQATCFLNLEVEEEIKRQ